MKSLINLSRVWFAIIISGVCYGAWASLNYLPDVVQAVLPQGTPYGTLLNITYGSLLLSIYGVMASLINVVMRELNHRYSGKAVLARLIPLERLLKITVLLIIANQALLTLDISARWNQIFYQLTRVVGTGTLGWFLFELIQIGEALLIQYMPSDVRNSIDTRQRYTHVVIVKRLLTLLLLVVTTAFILMGFERIRAAGTAILASAGVFATIVGFSARGLLESIFKGMQLIIAQPIRLLDTVAINGEVGVVTSITLHHAVVTLNDQSQLIVPTGDFLDKAFKNWTHSSNNLSGNILFYVKYNTPTELVSNKFQELLKASQYWDQGVGKVQVNELKSNLIELKLIMSAKNALEFSRLRNEVLEKLLAYMQTQHPERLP